MKKGIYGNGGYVGLIMVLITTVIIAFLVWKFGFLAPGSGVGRGAPQEDLRAIEQAKLLKQTLEQRDQQMLK